MSAIAPSTPPQASPMRLIATLAGIAVFSGLLLAMTYEVTLPMIRRNESEALEAAVFQVLPGAVARENYRLADGTLTAVPDERSDEANVYAGLNEAGERVGFALSGEARGYADVIRVLYGYNPDTEKVVGMTVLSSNETPGLGDRILWDTQFLLNFTDLEAGLNAEGTALAHEIVAVKHGEKEYPWQIDGISGATVSSQAVGKALRLSTNDLLPRLRAALKQEGTE